MEDDYGHLLDGSFWAIVGQYSIILYDDKFLGVCVDRGGELNVDVISH